MATEVVKIVSVPDTMTVFERAANQAFRDVVYSVAPRFPPDVVRVLTEWHRNNGGIIPWLHALGSEEGLAEAAEYTETNRAAAAGARMRKEGSDEQ